MSDRETRNHWSGCGLELVRMLSKKTLDMTEQGQMNSDVGLLNNLKSGVTWFVHDFPPLYRGEKGYY